MMGEGFEQLTESPRQAVEPEQDEQPSRITTLALQWLEKDHVRQAIADALKTKRQGCLIEIYDREAAMKAICEITEERHPRPKSNDADRQFIARKVGELAECESISRAEALALLKSLKPDWVALQEYEEEDAKLLDSPTCPDGWTPEEERFLKGLAQNGLKREGEDEDGTIASK